MTAEVLLRIPLSIHKALWSHLLRRRGRVEEAAFVYAVQNPDHGALLFDYADWYAVPLTGFVHRSAFHFELTDETRAIVIKRAHDLHASLVEFHSHLGVQPVQFSASDREGFEEFVPHARWRLKGRPYLAVVVARTGFDGYVWVHDAKNPQHLDGIVVEDATLRPTKLSPLRLEQPDE